MADTDREIIKQRQAGQAQAYGLANANSAYLETAKIHSRQRDFIKEGTENAATAVANTALFPVARKSRVKTVQYLSPTGATQNTSDYAVITVFKLTSAGASQTTVATYNTHNSAQGTITAQVAASFSVVANSDSTLNAGDTLHYAITKAGSGVAIAAGTFTLDLEEV